MTSFYKTLLKHESSLNQVKTSLYLSILKKTKDENTKMFYMKKLYFNLSYFNLKAIKNFFFLVKDVDELILIHTHEDIANECFMALETCVKNFKSDKSNGFGWYYNSVLNRRSYRLFQDFYGLKKISRYKISYDDYMLSNRNSPSEINETAQLIFNMDLESLLNDDEMLVMNSKLENISIKEFLKLNPQFSYEQYKECMASLKVKLIYLKDKE